jgi:hypothetical protein
MVKEVTKEELDQGLNAQEEVDISPDISEIEQEALQHGWNPEGVEGKKNLTAEEFMDRKQLYEDLRTIKRRNKRLEEKYDALEKHHKHVSEREREKLLLELKQAKTAALSQDDYAAVVEIDEQLAKARELPTTQDKVDVNEAFQEWKNDNNWYNSDSEMTEYADIVGAGYFNKHQNVELEEVYKYVSKEVKKRFPEKFESQRPKNTMVEGATRGRTVSKSKYSEKDLPEEDRQIMRTLVRSGALTAEQYLKEYFQ